jgi:formate/nitrite transporter FocA (FNT family)
MGFSLLTEAPSLYAGLVPAPFRRLIASLGYGSGFIIFILGLRPLFTDITLTASLPLLTRLDRATMIGIVRLGTIVLTANLHGAWCFAAPLLPQHVLEPGPQVTLAAIA